MFECTINESCQVRNIMQLEFIRKKIVYKTKFFECLYIITLKSKEYDRTIFTEMKCVYETTVFIKRL